MQEKLRLESGIKIQQLPEHYLRFSRITSPIRHGIGDSFIEIEQAIFCRGQRRQIPKRFRAAVNFVGCFRVLFQ